jgi:hypothetical protein
MAEINPLSLIGLGNDPSTKQRAIDASKSSDALLKAGLDRVLANRQSGANTAANNRTSMSNNIRSNNMEGMTSEGRSIHQATVRNVAKIQAGVDASLSAANLNLGPEPIPGESVTAYVNRFPTAPLSLRLSPDQQTALAGDGTTFTRTEDMVRKSTPKDDTVAPTVSVKEQTKTKYTPAAKASPNPFGNTINLPNKKTQAKKALPARVWKIGPDNIAKWYVKGSDDKYRPEAK